MMWPLSTTPKQRLTMKLLHLDSSILGTASVSRQISADIVARQVALHPGLEVVYHDLASDPALHLSGAHLAAFGGAPSDDAGLSADVAKGYDYVAELIAADIIVIGAPMYNFSIPSSLKSWVDRIAVAGKTFSYTEAGAKGLLVGKKAFIASARGNVYSVGSPAAGYEHQESYLIGLLGFLGVSDVTVVRAEGVAFGPEAKDAAIAAAKAQVAALAA
jgi:FMN-dependent NADH-azoreductase